MNADHDLEDDEEDIDDGISTHGYVLRATISSELRNRIFHWQEIQRLIRHFAESDLDQPREQEWNTTQRDRRRHISSFGLFALYTITTLEGDADVSINPLSTCSMPYGSASQSIRNSPVALTISAAATTMIANISIMWTRPTSRSVRSKILTVILFVTLRSYSNRLVVLRTLRTTVFALEPFALLPYRTRAGSGIRTSGCCTVRFAEWRGRVDGAA